jgi:hypothetical protein
VGATASRWGTSIAAQPPSVNHAPADGRTHVDATLRPAGAALPAGDASAAVVLTVDVVAQAPLIAAPRVSATVPAGWTVSVKPRILPVVSGRLPVSATATVTVHAPASVAPGSYPVAVTVTGPNTVTRTATIAVADPLSCAAAGPSCAVDLAASRTVDGTATVAAPDQGNFDGGGWSYDADLLPAAGPVTWGGVTYAAPDPTGTAANFVPATGQSLLLPAGFGKLNLIATAYNGPVTAGLTIGYTDGTYTNAAVTIADWCGTAAPGTTTALAMPHRIKAGQGVDGPPVNLYAATLPVPAGKQIRSLTLPDDPRINLYAVTMQE